MESASAPLRLRIHHVVYTKVGEVKPNGTDGWWVWFDGSRESLLFRGEEQPFQVGDKIKITFERID